MNTQERNRIFQSLILYPQNSVLRESESMFNVLHNDLLYIEQNLAVSPKEQHLRRTYIRALFALVECCTFRLKKDAMLTKGFPPGEIGLLEEIKYTISEKGVVKEGILYLGTLPNLRYAFRAFARAYKLSFDLNVEESGWSSFQEALKIRNSLTHPKRFLNLTITDPEWQTIKDAKKWFYSQLTALKEELDKKVGIPA